MVLEEHAKDPGTDDAPLKKKLAEAAADHEAAILQAARALLGLALREDHGCGWCASFVSICPTSTEWLSAK